VPLRISLNRRPLGFDSEPLFRRLLKLRLAMAEAKGNLQVGKGAVDKFKVR
jgi:hypothetical protein